MRIHFILIALLPFAACHTKKEPAVPPTGKPVVQADSIDTAGNYFPVTAFIKGDIASIKTNGITPKITVVSGTKTDSSFLKEIDFPAAFADFVSPVIDSANLKSIFKESKFLDRTLNAFTFSYDPANDNADTFAFRHWDVYLNADNNKVTRVYLVKKIAADTQLQLTWQSGKWCKIVTLKTTGADTKIEKEETISWSYYTE